MHDVFGLSAPVAGRVQRIEAHVGDPVVANDTVLARIEPVDPAFLDPRTETQARAAVNGAESALELARAEVEQARAEAEFAESQYRRARELIRSGTISQRDADDAERARRATTAALATAGVVVGSLGFRWYLSIAPRLGAAVGAVGAVTALLGWLYVFAWSILAAPALLATDDR